MKSISHRWTAFVVTALTLLIFSFGLPAAGRATEVQWNLYAPLEEGTVLPPEGDLRVFCGGYGFFDFFFDGSAPPPTPGTMTALPVEDGMEVPRGYPPVADTPPRVRIATLEPITTESTEPLSLAGALGQPPRPLAAAATGTAPLPCDGGSCFSPPGAGPWAAILDWNTWHGWTVGWTFLTLANSQVPASLFPVDDPALQPFFGQQITDLHVLIQLCRVAETAASPGVSPPVAVNMSFGRLAGVGDPHNGSCDPSSLACQIGGVIDHLRGLPTAGPNPPLVAASAGNHGLMLFPAAYAGVLAAGSLDLARFAADGTTSPSWETPSQAASLFPGNGICLEYPVADQQAFWPAPPGSSYATAVLTGWLAPSLVERPVASPHLGLWVPGQICASGSCAYVPIRNGIGYGSSNPPAATLLAQLLGEVRSACATPPESLTSTARDLGPAMSLDALPALAFPEVSPTLHHPTPEPSPCVPCEDGNGFQQGLRLAPLPAAARTADPFPTASDLEVELWASLPLTTEINIDTLYLRVDAQLFAVLLSPEDLDDLAAGTLGRLSLTGSAPLLEGTNSQPSLVFALREIPTGGEPETAFWTSSPLLLHPSGALLVGGGMPRPRSPGGLR